MENRLTRRDWFKSSLAITAGLTMASSLTAKLMASPASAAEQFYWGLKKTSSSKIRLNANENPYGPSDKARQAVLQVLSEGNRYPFQAIKELKSILAKKEGVTPEHIHATCNDYRAGATYDLAADEADRSAGRKIACPTLALWGDAGFPDKTGDALDIWHQWCDHVEGHGIDSGHFLAEENPQATLAHLLPFLKSHTG